MWHWLITTYEGFLIIYFITLVTLFGGLLWIFTPSEADREQERLEQRVNQLEEDLEREPKKLL